MQKIIVKYLPEEISAKELHNIIKDEGKGLKADKIFIPMNRKGLAFISVDDSSLETMINFLNSIEIEGKSVLAQKVLINPMKLFIGNIPFGFVNPQVIKKTIEKSFNVEIGSLDLKFSEDGKSKGYAIAMIERGAGEKLLNSKLEIEKRILKIYEFKSQKEGNR